MGIEGDESRLRQLIRGRVGSGTAETFFLADGGFIENLGLLPLLRHGCTDILVFENSDDDDEPFGAWTRFTQKLPEQEPGWRVSIPMRSAATGEPLSAVLGPALNRWDMPAHLWDAQLEKAHVACTSGS